MVSPKILCENGSCVVCTLLQSGMKHASMQHQVPRQLGENIICIDTSINLSILDLTLSLFSPPSPFHPLAFGESFNYLVLP